MENFRKKRPNIESEIRERIIREYGEDLSLHKTGFQEGEGKSTGTHVKRGQRRKNYKNLPFKD